MTRSATPQTMCELIAIVRRETSGWDGKPEDVWAEVGSDDLSRLCGEYDAARAYEAEQRGRRLVIEADERGYITEHEVQI